MTTTYNDISRAKAKLLLALNYQDALPQGSDLHRIRDIVADDPRDATERMRAILDRTPEIEPASWAAAERALHANLNRKVLPIAITDDLYPATLKLIRFPPPILYFRGTLDILDLLPGVAVVGMREASPNGLKISRKIAGYLAEQGFVIVSGLALGIDAAAHEGCLEVGGRTIAVLANGPDKATPLKNAELGNEILRQGGAWISEHPVGTPAHKHNFVPRNRIQIGLSAGSIIVEANARGGSMKQADFCTDAKRPLFAGMPQSPDNPLNLIVDGPESLVSSGKAIPLRSREDYPRLLQELLTSVKKLRSATVQSQDGFLPS